MNVTKYIHSRVVRLRLKSNLVILLSLLLLGRLENAGPKNGVENAGPENAEPNPLHEWNWKTQKYSEHHLLYYLMLHFIAYYSAPVGERSIAISLFVYLSVCLCVCLCVWLSVQEHIFGITKYFCADPLWPWLGPALAALRYVMYFWLYGWCHVWP